MANMPQKPNDNTRMTRISVNIPAEYFFKNNRGDCTIVDFSEGGIGIEVRQIFIEGDLIRIKAAPSNSLSLDIWCVARNIHGLKIGLEFEEISNQQREDLQKYVYSLLESNNKKRYENY